MTYTDTLFLGAFAIVFTVARLLRRVPHVKEAVLVAFSLALIVSWGLVDLVLLLAVLLFNYLAAVAMQTSEPLRRRSILAATIVVDLAVLAAFKYSNFLGANVAALSGLEIPQFPLGIPLAISFYTFHVISYLVDLNAGRIRNASIERYLFYMSFFPHVIAGPIVRAWQLVPQVGIDRRIKTDLSMGFHFFVAGLFLKLSADSIGRGIDPIWQKMSSLAATAADRWIVAFLYYCQIYGDFAGYSLMALGMARLLGYRLPANFRTPMCAASLQQFWQRWHITLSRWLRDYLYFPLGGSTHGALRTGLAITATMLLGGLWHGAAWGFVIWGAIHAAGLILERISGLRRVARSRYWPVSWLIVQAWVTIAWIFFRLPDLDTALGFLASLAPCTVSWSAPLNSMIDCNTPRITPGMWPLLMLSLPIVLHHAAPGAMRLIGRRRLPIFLGVATGIMLMLCLIAPPASQVFIYFRF